MVVFFFHDQCINESENKYETRDFNKCFGVQPGLIIESLRIEDTKIGLHGYGGLKDLSYLRRYPISAIISFSASSP